MPKEPPAPRIAYVFCAIADALSKADDSRDSLQYRPVIVPGVAGLLEQAYPFVRIVVVSGGKHPGEEELALLRGAIGVHLDEAASRREPLDLAHGANRVVPLEIVDGVYRHHGAEAAVRKRQAVGASEVQPPHHLGLAVRERVFGDVETERLQAGAHFHQVFHQKALGAADVEHAVARLQAEVANDVLGDRNPAAVVAIAAVAHVPRSVEITLAVLAGDRDVPGRLGLVTLADVAPGLRQTREQIDFGHGPISGNRASSARSPRRAA